MRFGIPVTTLPHIRHLLSSVLTVLSSGGIWCHSGQKAYFFHGSAWGISETIKTLLRSRGKTKGVVFLPDYFCNQALMPLRLLPVRLVFYPVTEHLNPDWPLIDYLVFQHGSPDVFILVHYFGFPGEIQKLFNFVNKLAQNFWKTEHMSLYRLVKLVSIAGQRYLVLINCCQFQS